jgi:DNA-binding response OmpR family regulator
MTRILIVDDDSNIVNLACAIFEDRPNLDVFTATDDIETEELAKDIQPDIILFDLTLPKRDGFTVLEMIKHDRDTSHAKVIIITGQSSGDAEATATKLGTDAFLGKPFDPMNLLKLAGELVHIDGLAA